MEKKSIILAGTAVAGTAGIVASVVFGVMKNNKTDDIVYRDTVVEYGTLTVGITEESAVSIGTIEQIFDLDISALVGDTSTTSSDTSSSTVNNSRMNNSAIGGFEAGGFFGGNGLMSFGNTETERTSEAQTLQVDEVLVTVGQQIQEGMPLFRVTDGSVEEIRAALQEDIRDTKEDYETLKVEQQASRLQASQGYDTYITNGKYAGIIYDNACTELQKKADAAKETVDDKQNQVNENTLELAQLQEELLKAQGYLKEAEGAVSENYNNRYENAYYYTVYENTRETAEKLVEQLEEKVESITEENKTLTEEIEEAVRSYRQALLDLEKGKLEAKNTYDTDMYYSSVASEWYAIQTTNLDITLQNALDSYNAALAKLEAFDAYIVDNMVLSAYNGTITDVMIEAEDTIGRNYGLVTLYDEAAVTMEVSLDEEDYLAVDKEGTVNIVYDAYPDAVYAGTIAEVSDAEYDSNSGKLYYTITVSVQGESAGLYEGMTGDVTFVTKETKEVLSVSNRAIFREGTRSYVKVRDENGAIVEKDVITGFSDGVNVEIVEGLSEGDVVLIESKVNGQ